jgi:hypothetical protein
MKIYNNFNLKHLSCYERKYGLFGGLVLPSTVKTLRTVFKVLIPIVALIIVDECLAKGIKDKIPTHLKGGHTSSLTLIDWLAIMIGSGGCLVAAVETIKPGNTNWYKAGGSAGGGLGVGYLLELVQGTAKALLI